MRIVKDISYSESLNESLRLDIYLPDEKDFSVFIYFHGGGLEGGDKADGEVFAEYLVKREIAVVSANYRLYPAANYPQFIEDAAEAAWEEMKTLVKDNEYLEETAESIYIANADEIVRKYRAVGTQSPVAGYHVSTAFVYPQIKCINSGN